MRHRVVNVKKIEVLGTRHFRHFHCEGQGVVWTGKQRIVCNVHPMEMKIVLWQVQPNWLSITKEVNFMATACQL